MNGTALLATLQRLWPKLPEEHAALIAKRCKNLPIGDDQVTAALEAEWERPANKVPPHERIIGALRNAARPTARGVNLDTGEHVRLTQMRRLLGLPATGGTPAAIVTRYWADCAARSVRLYGMIQPYVRTGAIDDLQTLASWTAAEALMWVDDEPDVQAWYGPPDEWTLTDKQRKAWGFLRNRQKFAEKLARDAERAIREEERWAAVNQEGATR